MTADATLHLMDTYVDSINDGALDRLEDILSANVVLHTPPHQDRFPGNVIARLRQERQAFPDLRLEVESAFTDEDGQHGVLVVRWMGRRMRSRVCLLFEIQDGRIASIEPYGGLAKTMYDAGLLRTA